MEKLLSGIQSLLGYFYVEEKSSPTSNSPPPPTNTVTGIAFFRLGDCQIVPDLEQWISNHLKKPIITASGGPIFVFVQSSGPRLYEEGAVIETLTKLKSNHSWVCLVILRYSAKEISYEDYSRYPCDCSVRFLYSTTQGIYKCDENEETWKTIAKEFEAVSSIPTPGNTEKSNGKERERLEKERTEIERVEKERTEIERVEKERAEKRTSRKRTSRKRTSRTRTSRKRTSRTRTCFCSNTFEWNNMCTRIRKNSCRSVG